MNHQPQRGEPFIQTERGILKDGSGLQAEGRLRMLSIALPNAGFSQVDDMIGPTARTLHLAIGPSQLNHYTLTVLKLLKV
jgi:hypothetical protein